MADLLLSKDGDLVLGNQALNDEGNLLYYVGNRPELAQRTTDSPEEDSYPIYDVAITEGLDSTIQLMQSIIKTDNPDWNLYPEIGINMSELAGELNTQKTAELGKDKILEAVAKSNYPKELSYSVDAVPVSRNEILYILTLESYSQEEYQYNFILNLDIGVLNYYELKGEMYK